MKRIAMITGGTKGLGKELSKIFLENNWHVSISGRSADNMDSASGGKYMSTRADMRYESDIERFFQRTEEKMGTPEVLVLNAGTISPCSEIISDSIINLRKDFEVNVFSNVYLSQIFLRKAKKGLIVHITSDVGTTPVKSWGFYGASKAAMNYLMDAMQIENPSMEFLSIDPGDMATEMHFIADPDADPEALLKPEVSARKVYNNIVRKVDKL